MKLKDFTTKKNNKIITLKKMDDLSDCLLVTAELSKEEYENLSSDEFGERFGNWTLKKLNMLYKLYEDIEKWQDKRA